MSHGRQTSGFHEMAGLTVVLPNPWRIRLRLPKPGGPGYGSESLSGYDPQY